MTTNAKVKYYIPSENKIMKFVIQAESKTSNGDICYLATDTVTGNDVWLYKDAIEFCNTNKPNPRIKHTIVSGYETKFSTVNPFSPYEYVWGGQVRNKRANSMCARPYFKY